MMKERYYVGLLFCGRYWDHPPHDTKIKDTDLWTSCEGYSEEN